MRYLAGLMLALLIAVSHAQPVSAYDDTISNISIPHNISMGAQGFDQGYIIYSVRMVDSDYECVLARDSEPHQYPTRTLTFDQDWTLIKDTGYQEVPKEEPKIEPKAAPEPPQTVTPPAVNPERRTVPSKPEEPPKPDIPIKPQEPTEPAKPEKPTARDEQ